MKNKKVLVIIIVLAVLALLFFGVKIFLYSGNNTHLTSTGNTVKPENSDSPEFVGAGACADCHKSEYYKWSGSHHELAMQEATDKTVLGDFDDKVFVHNGVRTRFYRKEGRFFVNTDGPDGSLRDYEIKYTFGVYPLQQYLVEYPGGRLQALGIAWDSRPTVVGGGHWFHLYPKDNVTHKDTIHWTGIDQNWNYMCAECHSTDLKKNYDLKTDKFNTTWSDINVSCEACHGPGSNHVKWAKNSDAGSSKYMGLLVNFDERRGITWSINKESGNAVRNLPKKSDKEIEVCGRCHSRRSVISDNFQFGGNLLNSHMPSLLEEQIYYPDGQIQSEDYEWGSFLQSKMYAKGVTCSDCHDPHTLKLRSVGNSLCSGCHLKVKYDTPEHHHHHLENAKGSACTDCHMPVTNYMVIDGRHDHSIRIPRPDLSSELDTPNACNKCHKDQTAKWAAIKITEWYKPVYTGYQSYGKTLYAARNGYIEAEKLLVELANDMNSPSIARATALKEIQEYLSPDSIGSVENGLASEDPLIRIGALDALQSAPADIIMKLAFRFINDPVLAVRLRAVPLINAVPRNVMTGEQVSRLDKAVAEYLDAQMINAERPESHMNIGLLYARMGKFKKAEAAYKTSLKIQHDFIPSYINLADLYRIWGKEDDVRKILEEAMRISPDNADVYHSLGLYLVRQKRIAGSVDALKKSVSLAPSNVRYRYVYAVALFSMGKTSESIHQLEEANKKRPSDRRVLYALVDYNKKDGDVSAALEYAEKLKEISPHDPNIAGIIDELKEIEPNN